VPAPTNDWRDVEPMNPNTFLGISAPYSDPETAAVHLVPLPYEGAVSYGKGASMAPEAILEASAQVELYDEMLRFEPYRSGIATLSSPTIPDSPDEMAADLTLYFKERLGIGTPRIIGIGGDHSVTIPHVRALCELHETLSVIQLDAHADLRESYEGTAFSHACIMRRVLECTQNTLQLGIRSLCAEEAQYIEEKKLAVCMMHTFRAGAFDMEKALALVPDPVFLTLDVDVLDGSIVSSTGTPEPGGVGWYELLDWLTCIFSRKNVIGFDVVELAAGPDSRSSAFAVAKLIYKMIGLMLR